MVDFRMLYKIAKEAFEKNLGVDCIGSLKDDKDYFVVDDGAGNEIDSNYKLFTKNFALEVECSVSIKDIDKEYGTWTKEYEARDVTKSYLSKDKYGVDKIQKWINDNIENFI